MATFKENFVKLWEKSFGEDKMVRANLPQGIYPEGTRNPLKKVPSAGILKRIWNDAVLGSDHRSREYETPGVITAARGVGATLGIGTALATVGTLIAGAFTSTAAVPILPALGTLCGLGAFGGVIRGVFSKPKAKEPGEIIVHTDKAGILREYNVIEAPPPKQTWKDKFNHVIECGDQGFELPLIGAYRLINTPIRLTGYAAHALNTAFKAAVETYKDDGSDGVLALVPADKPSANKNGFNI